uniref:OSK domain-containing protein n=1 Tax=Amphiprion ocellaris TaxID=80972 RepID=A0AAQ6AC87_AMPOC
MLIIGDSITRNIRFFNAITRCFPGATVQIILDKLPGILQSLPSTVRRIIVHVGCVDASRRQSEITKSEFLKLFQCLRTCSKAVFISGPIPPYNRGCRLFSRILGLNSWLLSACRTHNMGFIDNFNLFWNRPSFYRSDGTLPNKLGSSVLTGNIQHAVQSLPQD